MLDLLYDEIYFIYLFFYLLLFIIHNKLFIYYYKLITILNLNFIHSLKRHPGASDVPEQVELLAANAVDLHSIPGT